MNMFERIIAFFSRRRVLFDMQTSLDLVEVPVVTMRSNTGKKVNLMIDTGCNTCMLDEGYLELVGGTIVDNTDDESRIMTAGGGLSAEKAVRFSVSKNDVTFDITADIANIESLMCIEKETGVKIHGILGTNFLSKNLFVIDFATNIIYKK